MSPETGKGRDIVAVCFFADDSLYPNSGRGSATATDVYWHCIAVLAASLTHFCRIEILVFTNDHPPPSVLPLLHLSGVKLERIPFERRPPKGFFHAFSGAFYVLDAIEWAARTLAPNDAIVFLDPDCICASDPTHMFNSLRHHGSLFYRLDYELGQTVNGTSRYDMARIANMDGKQDPQPSYRSVTWLGGEIIGLTLPSARVLADIINDWWPMNLRLGLTGEPKFNTEEQFLSAAVHRAKLCYYEANDRVIARLWTSSKLRTYSESALSACIWHLPAEKKRGFPRVYRRLLRRVRDNQEIVMPYKEDLLRSFGLTGDWGKELMNVARNTFKVVTGLIAGKVNDYLPRP